MVKLLTIFNIIASAASIVGIYVILTEDNFLLILVMIFILSLPLSIYVLFVPNSTLEKNVRSKISRYENPDLNVESDEIIIQRGEFSIQGSAIIGVNFYTPFKVPPKVEVINNRGYTLSTPEVDLVSTEHVSFKRRGAFSSENQKYIWIARGVPLKQK